MSPDEEQQLRTLGQALEIVPGWVTLTSSPPPQLVAGSDLAYDDRRANPYQVSHAVWAAMFAGVSHLAVLRDSLFHETGPDRVEARIHTHGQFSLVRGALENASRAIWMLESDDANERLLRRLRLEWAESSAQTQVRELMGAPPGKSKQAVGLRNRARGPRTGHMPGRLAGSNGHSRALDTPETSHGVAPDRTGYGITDLPSWD